MYLRSTVIDLWPVSAVPSRHFDFLHGSLQQAELVATWVSQYNPRNIRPLTDIDAGGTQAEQAVEFGFGATPVGSQVEVQPVLHRLHLGHLADLKHRQVRTGCGQVHPVVGLEYHFPPECRLPELSNCKRVHSGNSHAGYTASHDVMLERA